MSVQSPSHKVEISLILPQQQIQERLAKSAPSSNNVDGRYSSLEELQGVWDDVRNTWGVDIVRKLICTQKCFSASGQQENQMDIGLGTTGSVNISGQCSTEIVDEKIVITEVQDSSPAHQSGLKAGDIICAIHGIENPKLQLLFKVLRDFVSIQITVERSNHSEEKIVKPELVEQGTQTENDTTVNNISKELSDTNGIITENTQQKNGNSTTSSVKSGSLEHHISQKEVERPQPQSFSSSRANPHRNNDDTKEDMKQTTNSNNAKSAEINSSSTTNTSTNTEGSTDLNDIKPKKWMRIAPTDGTTTMTRNNREYFWCTKARYGKGLWLRQPTEKDSDDCGKKKKSSQSSGSNGAVSFHSSVDADHTPPQQYRQPQSQLSSSSIGKPHHNNENTNADTKQISNTAKSRSDNTSQVRQPQAQSLSSSKENTHRNENIKSTSGNSRSSPLLHQLEKPSSTHKDKDTIIAQKGESILHGSHMSMSSTSTVKDGHIVLTQKEKFKVGRRNSLQDNVCEEKHNPSKVSDVTSSPYVPTRNKGGNTSTKDSKRQKQITAHTEQSFVHEKATTSQDDMSSANNKVQPEMKSKQDEDIFFNLISDNIKKRSNSMNEMKQKTRRRSRSSSFIDTLSEPSDQLHFENRSRASSTASSSQDPIQGHPEGKELISQKGVVSASPAPMLKYASLPSGLLVTSTSSKAGLPVSTASKFKRLWPDSSIFSKRILKWTPPQLDLLSKGSIRFKNEVKTTSKAELNKIPPTFSNTPDIIKHLTPHILEEGLLNVQEEFLTNSDVHRFWNRETYKLHLYAFSPIEPKSSNLQSSQHRLYQFSFLSDKSNASFPPMNAGELYALHSPSWKHSNKCCLAFVGSGDSTNLYLLDQRFKDRNDYDMLNLNLCVYGSTGVDTTGWLPECDLPQKNLDGSIRSTCSTIYALNIGTITDTMRQYEALQSLRCLNRHLQKTVFSNSAKSTSTASSDGMVEETIDKSQIKKPSSVDADVWQHIGNSSNPYQLSSIEKIMSGKIKENVALIQGPPGCGKTSTIINLVSAILNGSIPAHGSKKRIGTRIQVGKSLCGFDHTSLRDEVVSERILICAPSHHAVDELTWRLHEECLGLYGKVGGFKIVRVGKLPDETRHDGRGKRMNDPVVDPKRNKYLHSVNLENLTNKLCQDHTSSGTGGLINNTTQQRQTVLDNAHIVCCTISGSGSKAFIDSVLRDKFPNQEFSVVIVDEACQVSEGACLIPFKFNPSLVVLVGDPKQLPVVTRSRQAETNKSNRSLFERLKDIGWPVHFLSVQYRMNKEISLFPSRTFYHNRLSNSEEVLSRLCPPWYNHSLFPPYLFWNISNGRMSYQSNGTISNQTEINFIFRLLNKFVQEFNPNRKFTIGIISFYNEQVRLIRNKFLNSGMMNALDLQISTVDGFQGSEKDIIILSCVRAPISNNACNRFTGVGFLNDYRRLNVALTRAKHSLWIVGHCTVLSTDTIWNDLLNNARERELITNESFFANSNNYRWFKNHQHSNNGKKNRRKQQTPSKSNKKKRNQEPNESNKNQRKK